jgi:hypothetical protein
MPSEFRLAAISLGLRPAANSVKMRRTTSASRWSTAGRRRGCFVLAVVGSATVV